MGRTGKNKNTRGVVSAYEGMAEQKNVLPKKNILGEYKIEDDPKIPANNASIITNKQANQITTPIIIDLDYKKYIEQMIIDQIKLMALIRHHESQTLKPKKTRNESLRITKT